MNKLTIDSKTGICDNTTARATIREVAHNHCSFCKHPLDQHAAGTVRAVL